jgi:hypothetical protein
MTEGQKDPEAEALIRRATAERHGAPYYLVQTVLIQDLSLHSAENRITDLETQLTEIKSTSPGAPSFLGAPTAPLAPDSGLAGGNGFLRSAAMTAAGIVGGALVFEGIQSMFGQHDAATITGNQAALLPHDERIAAAREFERVMQSRAVVNRTRHDHQGV